jgi:Protein of unknown function (DUF3499)
VGASPGVGAVTHTSVVRPRASTGPEGLAGTVCDVSPGRRCSRTACGRPAVLTLTYVYAEQTAVIGPLATYAEPHSYDLCDVHGERLSAPRGWEVLRLAPDPSTLPPSDDDLLALADAVREAGRPLVAAGRAPGDPAPAVAGPAVGAGRETGRRGHLRVLTSE